MRTLKACSLHSFLLPVLIGIGCLVVSSASFHAQPQSVSPTLKEPTSYRDVVKKVLPAVVSIEAKSATPVGLAVPRLQRSWPSEFDLPLDLRRFFEEAARPMEIPEIYQRGFGSGFVVDPAGVIVTNHHVVKGAQHVTIHLQDGRTFESKEIKSDPKSDLAVIRIAAASPLPHVEFGESSAVEIGDRVLAFGSPFGFTGSVSAGIVSGKGRNPNLTIYEDYLQTDAAINPGNSGGPLVSLDGKVVGVSTAIKSSSGGSQGVGFAIPSNLVRNIMDKLLKNGVVERGYLGVQVRALDPDVGARLGAENRSGVVVARVLDASPAAKAGLQAGDVILAVAGNAVKEPSDLQRRVAAFSPNKTVAVTILRDGASRDVQVTLEEQPSEAAGSRPVRPNSPRSTPATRVGTIGIEVADLNGQTARQFGYAETTAGAVVTSVEPGSLAAQVGIRPGTLITKVDDAGVTTAAEARDSLEKASLRRGIVLRVQSPDSGISYLMLKAS
jgi:serine protease Do